MEIWEIIRRYRAGQTIRFIARAMGYDRKTVRKYIKHLRTKGMLDSGTTINKKEIAELFQESVTEHQRPSQKQSLLEPYLEELKDLVTEQCLKPKTAFKVICGRHDLEGKVSYTSFKRFVRRNQLALNLKDITCRIETEPAEQLQIDYCKVGTLYDPLERRSRTLYAFIATLSFSRHKFIEFIFRQDQQSFVNSHVKAFSYFGGVPKTIVLDNLKDGVIKPDLYDPQFNRAYRELAEHYGTFLDPARIRSPKDKGKVERDVPTVREKFRELIALYPTIVLLELNHKALDWLVNGYGMTKHGTTHQMPYMVFQEEEQPKLIPLPHEAFEAAFWKEATVHPDCYIQVKKKSYSVPYQYAGKKVWVKVSNNIVQVFLNEQLIKEHVIPSEGYRKTDLKDFPENIQAALDKGLPRFLQDEAAKIGTEFRGLVGSILAPHAFMNLRRAQGIITVAKKYPAEVVEQAASQLILSARTNPRSGPLGQAYYFTPKYFKASIEKLIEMEKEPQQIPLSEQTQSFIRDINYFDHTSEQGDHYVQ